MKFTKIIYTALIALIFAMAVGACSNNDDRAPSASVALLGIWHLRSVNNQVVTGNASRSSYYFRTDTEKPSNSSGVGDFYQYFAATDSEQSFPFSWEIDEANHLVITGTQGAGVFEFSITSTQTYMQLELVDVESGNSYLYMK